MGYAHPSGMRKITDKFKKGPTLTLVDLPDAKSVFIPEWIHRFKLDVYRVRREEVKSQKWIPVKAPISTDYPNPKEELHRESERGTRIPTRTARLPNGELWTFTPVL
ncbi:hypothetical protein TNCT_620271 [Trichonephila clavata]|uniref:Uncharacterized protein n=1 Tax=Trichonephila clavata TaxID=2740835 RepID=A0A8X6KIU5_TRICU|nr:hypothetical protein TNCT_620271 [Trichonephila clavata]